MIQLGLPLSLYLSYIQRITATICEMNLHTDLLYGNLDYEYRGIQII
jgi:hypothetical protein